MIECVPECQPGNLKNYREQLIKLWKERLMYSAPREHSQYPVCVAILGEQPHSRTRAFTRSRAMPLLSVSKSEEYIEGYRFSIWEEAKAKLLKGVTVA